MEEKISKNISAKYGDIKKYRSIWLNLLMDIVLIISSFFLASFFKSSIYSTYLFIYFEPFVFFALIFFFFSLIQGKYGSHNRLNYLETLYTYFKSLFITFSFCVIIIYFFKLEEYSRFMVMGTVLILAALELIWISVYYAFIESVIIKETGEIEDERTVYKKTQNKSDIFNIPENEAYSQNIRKVIEEETHPLVYEFLDTNIDLSSNQTSILSTTTRFSVNKLQDNSFNAIVNLTRINDIKRINKFFESVNAKLKNNGLFVICVETYTQRKGRILSKYPPLVNWIVYIFDFIYKRVAPKMPLTKGLYFWLTGGNNRVISKAETLGRLYSCGFEIVDENLIEQNMWFIVRKKKEPAFDYEPTYGPLIKLKRYGKDGREFRVYKMRTMHAYSEYIQDYIYQRNALEQGGKFKDDFRITTLGAIMRKLWIDELPMFINVFKGEMKIVGVRPLSKHYFNLYNEELKQKRIKFKPGLIPPFYADLPKTLDEIMDSEMRYLQAYEKNPFRTDWKYFWKAMDNIIIKKARSA